MSENLVPPNGEFLLPIVWRQDPTSSLMKYIFVATTIFAVVLYSICPFFLINGLDRTWDTYHTITFDPITGEESDTISWIEIMFRIIEETMGISSKTASNILTITVGFYIALVAGDYLGRGREVWPKHWEVGNTICYEEMFTEPTRLRRLLRRPGNTLSNFIYLYCAVCIILSVVQSFINPVIENTFTLADGLFSIMLLILSIASTIWHGSNAPSSHYVDLWSMDCVTIFPSIRVICLGFGCFLVHILGANASTAKFLSGWICVGLFLSIIVINGWYYYGYWKKRWLHGRCPLSVRARLSNKSDMYMKGHISIGVMDACLYVCIPPFSLVAPILVQYIFIGSAGSVLALKACQVSFIIGWYYRINERFALDGCVPMNIICRQRPSIFRTVLAAIFSPTAVLHFFTGITLLMSYTHARSVEQSAF